VPPDIFAAIQDHADQIAAKVSPGLIAFLLIPQKEENILHDIPGFRACPKKPLGHLQGKRLMPTDQGFESEDVFLTNQLHQLVIGMIEKTSRRWVSIERRFVSSHESPARLQR
jgi:hypothetical protein